MEGSFQSQSKVYFVTEYIEGGDLNQLLRKKKQLCESFVKFYIAEMVLALEELYKK